MIITLGSNCIIYVY